MYVVSSEELGALVRQVRKSIGMTQRKLAGASGVGVRFIIDLESGKPTCELGRTLHVLSMLGIRTELKLPTQTPIAKIEKTKS